MVGEDVDVPALGAEGGEVGEGRLGAGNDDEVGGRQRAAGFDDFQAYAGGEPQRVEIVEIGNARQARHGNGEGPLPACWRRLQREHVLGRELAGIGIDRDRAETGDAGVIGDEDAAVLEESRIALKLVHQRRGDERAVVGIDDAEGADE